MVTIAGFVTPYVTPAILTNAPTGIAWSTIPSIRADADAKLAEVWNICNRATSMVNATCNNILRSTIDTETQYGPDYRVTINRSTWVTRMLLSRYPVTEVLSGQVSAASTFPPQYVSVAADQFLIENPPIGLFGSTVPSGAGDGGQAIMIAPGFVSWQNGRNGFRIQVTYVNGWPHGQLTAPVTSGSASLVVNDCTGWGPPPGGTDGASGIIYDGTNQETVVCTAASAISGPGTLTLASPVAYTHGTDTVISALPGQVMQAAILFAVSEALIRGATATTIMTISGTGEPMANQDHRTMECHARDLCRPYRRRI
jgi:hypothetical protein